MSTPSTTAFPSSGSAAAAAPLSVPKQGLPELHNFAHCKRIVEIASRPIEGATSAALKIYKKTLLDRAGREFLALCDVIIEKQQLLQEGDRHPIIYGIATVYFNLMRSNFALPGQKMPSNGSYSLLLESRSRGSEWAREVIALGKSDPAASHMQSLYLSLNELAYESAYNYISDDIADQAAAAEASMKAAKASAASASAAAPASVVVPQPTPGALPAPTPAKALAVSASAAAPAPAVIPQPTPEALPAPTPAKASAVPASAAAPASVVVPQPKLEALPAPTPAKASAVPASAAAPTQKGLALGLQPVAALATPVVVKNPLTKEELIAAVNANLANMNEERARTGKTPLTIDQYLNQLTQVGLSAEEIASAKEVVAPKK
jgi:hypothetical protein